MPDTISSHFEWFGLHKLKRRVVIEGTVVNEEPLRIGAGRGAAVFEPVDLVVIKIKDATGREYPFIPGSSWKGALRSYAVKLMRSAGLKVCDGVPRSTCLRGREFEQFERSGVPVDEVIKSVMDGNPGVCLACMIFGSPGLASHARFYDSYPSKGFRLGYRTMVAIDRRTGTARQGALFTVEYVEPGAEFGFRAELINLPNYAVGIIAESLLDMDAGILKLGGLRTRGFGWLRFRELQVRVYDYGEGKWLRDSVPGLGPIDPEVSLSGEWRDVLTGFAEAWRRSVSKLRKVSEAGWRWASLLE